MDTENIEPAGSDKTDFLELIATVLADNEDGATQLREAYELETTAHAGAVSELENRNGDAMTQLAAMEQDRDALASRVESLTAELTAVKAANWDKLMNGGDSGSGIAADPDTLVENPDDDDSSDITPEELIAKFTN